MLCSPDGEQWTRVNSGSIHFGNIGFLHQGLCTFPAVPGAKAYYRVASPAANSSVFTIQPVPARGDAEVFAVWGDFGLTNDVCLNDIIAEAQKGTFDRCGCGAGRGGRSSRAHSSRRRVHRTTLTPFTHRTTQTHTVHVPCALSLLRSVLHVGDWAYDFDSDASIVGNLFMNAVQPYMSIKPTMPVEGNHEACGLCEGVPELPRSAGNYSEYKLRFHSTSLYAGANSGSNNNRYYSFNQGFTHFIVFTAEAYLYARDNTFLANQAAFMAADLAAVDRSVTPWVVALVHKDWTMETEAFNVFTPILDKGGVDVLFCGCVWRVRVRVAICAQSRSPTSFPAPPFPRALDAVTCTITTATCRTMRSPVTWTRRQSPPMAPSTRRPSTWSATSLGGYLAPRRLMLAIR